MSFEVLRRAKQSRDENAARLKEAQDAENARRQAVLQAEKDRIRRNQEVERARVENIRVERKRAMDVRNKSGLLHKMGELISLVQGMGIDYEVSALTSTPSSVVDKIWWDRALNSSRPLKEVDYTAYNDHGSTTTYAEEVWTEKFILVETFPDGSITFRGKYKSLFNKGCFLRLNRADWSSSPMVFESCLKTAYDHPEGNRYKYRRGTTERYEA